MSRTRRSPGPAGASPVCALLLTAGRSRRMGMPKAWLRLGGESLLRRIARNALDGGAHRLVVVVGCETAMHENGSGPLPDPGSRIAPGGRTGPIEGAASPDPRPDAGRGRGTRSPPDGSAAALRALDASRLVSGEEVERALAPLGGRAEITTMVGHPDGQPIDSIRAGLALVPEGDSLLLWPVDYPFAEANLVERLGRALGDRPDHVSIPTVSGRLAHPVLLGHQVALELATRAADEGARAVVHADDARIIRVATEDARLLLEINTPAQAAACGICGFAT